MQEQSAENLQFQNQNQSIMFQSYFERYDTCLPYTRQNFMSEKDSMKQFIVKKNILKFASEKAKSKFERIYSKNVEDILKQIQRKFTFIDSLLTNYPFVNVKTYQAFDNIKGASLQIHNMLFIIAIKQISRQNKNIDHQECKRMIQAAKIQYQASSQDQLEEILKNEYEQYKQLQLLFKKSNNKEKLKQTEKTISKIEKLLNILKQYIKSEELYVQVAFDIPFLKLSKEILITMDSTGIDIFSSLEIQKYEDLVIQIFKREAQSYVKLQNNKKLNDIVQRLPKFKGKIKKIFIVTFQNQSYKFSQNTSLQIIKDKLRRRNKTYGFWDENHREIEDQYLTSHLQMFEFDQNIQLAFNDTLIKNCKLPSSVSFKQLVRFVNLEYILPRQGQQQIKNIDDPYINFSIHLLEINDKILNLIDQQHLSINFFARERIQKLYLSYKIYITIDLLSNREEGQKRLIGYGDMKIKQLKNILTQQTGLYVQKQKWSFQEQQLKDEEIIFKRLNNIYQNKIKIDVKQIKNLQYYGFARIKQQIESNLFYDYSIEDDEKFINNIKKSRFPDDEYESSFRTACLRIIFASIKKHCSISSSINHIKQMISNIKLQNKHRNELKGKLWLSFVKKDISRFNQGYIFHYLLLYSSGNLRVAIMNSYKNQSPIFYKTLNEKNQVVSYHNEHFWLSNRSLVIASIQIGDEKKCNIKGKSNALNMIFQTRFQIAQTRNISCSKSILISYDIYRNNQLPVNLIDISSGSCTKEEKIRICNACNIVIVHYSLNQRALVEDWCQTNLVNKLCILLERDNDDVIDDTTLWSNELNNNLINKMRKHYTLPELSKQKKQHFANKLSPIVNQINSLVQSQILSSINVSQDNHNNLWMFLQFLSQNDQQKINALKNFKSIELKFQSVVNLQILTKNPEKITPFQLQTMVISQDCQEILKFLKSKENSQNYFSMLRYFIRSLRDQRLKYIERLLQLFQNKQIIISLQQKVKEQEKNQIIKKINTLISIPAKRKNKKFQEILSILRKKINEQDFSDQLIKESQKLVYQLNIILNTVLKQRQLSIQNLWRGLSILFNPKITVPKSISVYKDQTQHLFNQTFKEGSYFQIINGDTMEISINLMKCLQYRLLNDKKILVVGVLGPQSSGKSTLLNYLFGCDFACSDGRCTSGVYGTYYQLSGGIYNFQGIFILDTQGLFSAHERQDPNLRNYDNKLVLFLIRICDIIIINTRGDIDGKCQQIVEVSFDSEFMDNNNGGIYPHVFTAINHNGRNLTMSSQQSSEVRKFIQNIIRARKEMEKFISFNQAQSLPTAFNVNDKTHNSIVLQRIQKKQTIPTEDFNKKTKQLSLKIMKVFKQRNPRYLADVLNQMNAIWYSILANPTYTQFKSKFMRQQSFILNMYTADQIKKYLDVINSWIKLIPEDIKRIQSFNQQKEKQFKTMINGALQQYQREKIQKQKDSDLRQLASSLYNTVKYNIQLKMKHFKLTLQQRKKEVELKQFKQRGLYLITKKARQQRQQNKQEKICNQDKQAPFNEVWEQYSCLLMKNNTKEKISQRKYQQVKKLYQQFLNEQNVKITLNYDYTEMIRKQQQSLKQYSDFLQNDIKNNLVHFHSYFTEIQEEPIIITSPSGNTSIKGQYLKMWQFFKLQKSQCLFYLNKMSLNDIWNQQSLKQFMDQNLNTTKFKYFFNYFTKIHKCLQYFCVTVKTQYMQKFQRQIINSFISQLENIMNKRLNSNYKFNFSKEHFDIKIKKQSRALKFLGIKDSTINNFKCFHQQFNLQQSSFSGFSDDGDLSLLNYSKLIDKIKELYESSHAQTQLAYIKTLIQYTLPSYIKKYQIILLKSYKELKQRYSSELRKALQEVGIKLEKNKVKQIDQAKQYIKQGSLITYNQNNSYTIQGYKLIDCCKSYRNLPEMYKKINSYSFWIQSYNIIQNITQKPVDEQSILIAKVLIQKYYITSIFKQACNNNSQVIRIFSSYLDHDISDIAQNIKTPIFKKIIENYIKKFAFITPIFNYIDENVGLNGNLEDYIRKINAIVDLQISKFNNDLKQIAHCIFKDFRVKIYNYSACLLSKKLQILSHNQAKEAQKAMMNQRDNQKIKFFRITEGNESTSSAHLFIEYYQKHLQQQVRQKKKKYINQKIDCFLEKYKTEKFLQQISQKLMQNQSAIQAYQYLTDSREYLNKQYNKLINKDIQQKSEQIKSLNPNLQLEQIINFFEHQKIKIVQKYGDKSSQKSQAHILFTYDSGKSDQNILLAKLFIAILKKNPIIIDQNYHNNQFQLQKNVKFNADYTFNHHINTAFIQRNDFNDIGLQISNYYQFLNEALNILFPLKQKIKDYFILTQQQRQSYQQRVKLQFCNHQCPFCSKHCEIDLRQHKGKRHKSSLGHQLRAMKDITINLSEKGKIKKFGSVYRCQQIFQNERVSFNGKIKSWRQHRQQQQQWDFHIDNDFQSKELYAKMWRLAGNQICQQKRQLTKSQFQFISLEDFQRKQEKMRTTPNHYIFSLDSSGYLLSQDSWKNQLESIKIFLSNIQNINQIKVSIIVWGFSSIIYYRNANIQEIDVNIIHNPWNLSWLNSSHAFKGAIEIIKQCNHQQNIILVYTLNGDITFPTAQIQQLKELKLRTIQNQRSFKSIAININSIQNKSKLLSVIDIITFPFSMIWNNNDIQKSIFQEIVNQLESQVAQCTHVKQIGDKLRQFSKKNEMIQSIIY